MATMSKAVAGAYILALATCGASHAQSPKTGGILKFAVVAEPPSMDCHAVNTFAFIHPVRAHYSTLLTFKGSYADLRIVGDLASSWEVAEDGLSYAFKLRDNVKFHDGSSLTSEDVKVSYERIINPPAGVVSLRRALYQDINSIETPNSTTVIFRMKFPNASMLTHFASPWNCIYSAAKLKEDPQFPAKSVLGTGAFEFVEYRKGKSWTARRFPGYFLGDRPYLSGYQAFFVKGNAVAPGIIGGQFDAEFRGRTPKERDQIVEAMKDKAIIVAGPWTTNLMFSFNTKRKPFDDLRVRQALTLAIDRWGGAAMLGKISVLKHVSGMFRPGYEFGLPRAELEKIPGFWPDIDKSRAEAKRLLAEAGVSNLKLRLVNRNLGEPHTPAAIYLMDQWKRIGVEAEHVQLETKLFYDAHASGNFDIVMDFISDFADDPSAQFDKFLSAGKSAQSVSRHTDAILDDLFDRQARSINPLVRKRLVHQFETRGLTQAYSAPILWWDRTVVHHRRIKGWELHPSHFTGFDFVDVWLDE